MGLISRDVQPPTSRFDVTITWPNGNQVTLGPFWTVNAATERALDEAHKVRHLPSNMRVDIHETKLIGGAQ